MESVSIQFWDDILGIAVHQLPRRTHIGVSVYYPNCSWKHADLVWHVLVIVCSEIEVDRRGGPLKRFCFGGDAPRQILAGIS